MRIFLTLYLCFMAIAMSKAQISPSIKPGFYELPFELELMYPEGQTIYYTLNGSIPTTNSKKYTSPIPIDTILPRSGDISFIPTTPLSGPYQLTHFKWVKPSISELPQLGTVVSVRAFQNNEPVSETQFFTYFVGEKKQEQKFPVLSLVTEKAALFSSDSGLFVPGDRFNNVGWGDDYWADGNYRMKGKDWERTGNLSYFDEHQELQFSTNIGFRIHGAVVGVMPQKSIRIYLREKYGAAQLDYPLFNSSDANPVSRFILRNSGNDFISTHFRDALLSETASDLGLEHQDSKPAVLYINGEYWGLINIRERLDKYYFKAHFSLAKTDYDMLESLGDIVNNGSKDEWIQLLQYINNNDLSKESIYNKVSNEIDIENYIDYQLFQTFFCNMDWPGNNVKFWRPKDGKWRWIFFDGDATMSTYAFNIDGGIEHDAIAHASAATNNKWYNSKGATFLFRNLLKNKSFRSSMASRYNELSQSIFNPIELEKRIQHYQDSFAPEMQRHINRWGYPKNGMEGWLSEVEKLKEFVRQRPSHYQKHLAKMLGHN